MKLTKPRAATALDADAVAEAEAQEKLREQTLINFSTEMDVLLMAFVKEISQNGAIGQNGKIGCDEDDNKARIAALWAADVWARVFHQMPWGDDDDGVQERLDSLEEAKTNAAEYFAQEFESAVEHLDLMKERLQATIN